VIAFNDPAVQFVIVGVAFAICFLIG